MGALPMETVLFTHLFHEVQNAGDIRNFIFNTKIPVCLVNPSWIWDKFHLDAALSKALQNQRDETMKTRSLPTEILYWLSPTSNITESLKTMGAGDDAQEFIVVATSTDFHRIRMLIGGKEIAMDKLKECSRNEEAIKKFYGLDQVGEMYQNSPELLSGCLVSKIMTKDLC